MVVSVRATAHIEDRKKRKGHFLSLSPCDFLTARNATCHNFLGFIFLCELFSLDNAFTP